MDVFMYTLSTCPWCRKTKQFFKEKNIPFKYVDYDLAQVQEQEKIIEDMSRRGGKNTAFPFVVVDGNVVVGYNPDRYMELLGQNKGKKK